MSYSREVRVGLVLYGGVSLAVYENGVAQEFFRAVKGEGIYGLLKDLTDSDIVVDVISGTSAGGVNGILLAYALANGLDFAPVAELWRNQGDIAKLLRKKNDPGEKSLLDSENFYQNALENALRSLPRWTETTDSISSRVSELVLFVTGTDVDGSIRTVFDDRGQPVDVKDHRAVFELHYREGSANDLTPDAIPELAMLARLTSCFPVAFAPVEANATHKYLRNWGNLQRDAVFLDGGILDNKPFTYALDAIFRRKADRDVQRLLYYVEPDPERFTTGGIPQAPGPLRAAISALVRIPGYESISSDLERIGRHNETVARLEELIRQVCDRLPVEQPPSPEGGILPPDPAACGVYLASRMGQLRNRAVEGILNDGTRRRYFTRPEERRSAQILVKGFSHLDDVSDAVLTNYDVYFRIRRLYHLTYTLLEAIYRRKPPADVASYRDLWRTVNHYLELFEVVQGQMERLVDNASIQWQELHKRFVREGEDVAIEDVEVADLAQVAVEMWELVATRLDALLKTDVVTDKMLADESQLPAFQQAMDARCRAAIDGAAPADATNLLHRLDAAVAALLTAFDAAHPDNAVTSRYAHFVHIDQQVFPLQYAADVHTRDLIKVVRLSPVDAQRGLSRRAMAKKICGNSLGAFGGFFKKPWRANDILWGRLDGLCQILECTLTRARLRDVTTRTGPIADLQGRLENVFKETQKSEPQAIRRIVQHLSSAASLSDSTFESLLTEIVTAAHREILAVEWPRVISDALEQDRDWSYHREGAVAATDVASPEQLANAYSAERLAWRGVSKRTDGLIVALAAKAAANPQFDLFESYQLAGRPFADEIPKPVLVELVTLSLLRLERSLMAELPKWQRLRVRVVHSFLFKWVLPTLYGWARFSRTAPEYGKALAAAVISSSLVLFALTTILWWVGIESDSARFLSAIAALIILGWVVFFRRA